MPQEEPQTRTFRFRGPLVVTVGEDDPGLTPAAQEDQIPGNVLQAAMVGRDGYRSDTRLLTVINRENARFWSQR